MEPLKYNPDEWEEVPVGALNVPTELPVGFDPNEWEEVPIGTSGISQETTEIDRSFVGDIASRFARGGLRAVKGVTGAMRMLDLDPTKDEGILGTAGKFYSDLADKVEKEYDIFKPDIAEIQDEEGLIKRGFGGAIESTPASLLPFAGGAATGAVAGSVFGPVGAVIGGVLGGGATLFATFGLGEYQNAYDETVKILKEKGLPEDEIKNKAGKHALKSSIAEAGGEVAGDLAALTFFGAFGKQAVKQTVKQSIKQLLSAGGIKEFGKSLAKTIPFEAGSEMWTAYVQAKSAKDIGISDISTTEAMKEAVLPAVFMSLIFGGSIRGMQAVQARNTYNKINSQNPEDRIEATKIIAGRLDKEERNLWLDTARQYIEAGKEIPISAPIVDFATQKTDETLKTKPKEPEIPEGYEEVPIEPIDKETLLHKFEKPVAEKPIKEEPVKKPKPTIRQIIAERFDNKEIAEMPVEEFKRRLRVEGLKRGRALTDEEILTERVKVLQEIKPSRAEQAAEVFEELPMTEGMKREVLQRKFQPSPKETATGKEQILAKVQEAKDQKLQARTITEGIYGTKEGQAFKNKGSASLNKVRMEKDHGVEFEPVEVEDGWGLQRKVVKEVAPEKAKAGKEPWEMSKKEFAPHADGLIEDRALIYKVNKYIENKVGSSDPQKVFEYYQKKYPETLGDVELVVTKHQDPKKAKFGVYKGGRKIITASKPFTKGELKSRGISTLKEPSDLSSPAYLRHEIEHALDYWRAVKSGKRAEYIEKHKVTSDFDFYKHGRFEAEYLHRGLIKEALKEGKQVPKEILAEYPDLAPAKPQPPALPKGAKAGVAEKPKKPVSKIRTLRGAIKELGGLNFLNFTGELRDLNVFDRKAIANKKGIGIDKAIDELIADGWLHQDTTVESFLEELRTNPKELLSRDRVTADITTKKPSELSAEEKRFKAEMEWKPEAPPEGEYITMEAEDLPKGKRLTLLEGKTARGWDIYEVISEDPFEITLKDGNTITLSPKDKVEVLKSDVAKKGIETISPDGTTVNWDKTRVSEKDGIKATYYATHKKDGTFKGWRTESEINRIKEAKGKTLLDLRQEAYGKQKAITGEGIKEQQELGLGVKKEDELFKKAEPAEKPTGEIEEREGEAWGISQDEVRQMIDRFYKAHRDYYDKREDFYDQDASTMAMELESDYEIYNRYLKNLPEDVYLTEIIEAYRKKELPEKVKPKAKKTEEIKIPEKIEAPPIGTLGEPTKLTPLSPKKLGKLWEIANKRLTKLNEKTIQTARFKIFLHQNINGDVHEKLGISEKEINAKLRTWSNYPLSARGLHNRINAGQDIPTQWTGIINSAYIAKQTVSIKSVDSFVKNIEVKTKSWGTPNGDSLRNYIVRTLLAIDTRIKYSDLTFIIDSTLKPNGLYENSKKTITVRSNSPNTIAHEIGHYLDHKWAQEGYPGSTNPASTMIDTLRKGVVTEYSSALREQWLNRFHDFVMDISERSELGSEYYQDRKEVFARFISKFIDWTNEKTGVKTWKGESYASDRFNENDYLRFVRLLQEKAYVDIAEKPAGEVPKYATKEPISDTDITLPEAIEGDVVSLKEAIDRFHVTPENLSDITRSPFFIQHLDKLLSIPVDARVGRAVTKGIERKPASSKSLVNRMSSDIQFLSNIINGSTFREKGFSGLDIKTQRLVVHHMLRLGRNEQVLNSIVKFIPVDVMNDLGTLNLSPKMFFKDASVLKKALTTDLSFKIPIGSDVADTLAKPLALRRTKEKSALALPVDLTTITDDSLSAKTAGDIGSSTIIKAITFSGAQNLSGLTISDTIRSLNQNLATLDTSDIHKDIYTRHSRKSQVKKVVTEKFIQNIESLLSGAMKKHGVSVKLAENEKDVLIKTKGGHVLTLNLVDVIAPREDAFFAGYHRQKESGEIIAGSYEKNTIKIAPIGDKWTIAHEMFGHWVEDTGLITPKEINVLKWRIKRLVSQGKFETQNKDDIGGQEDRAVFIEKELHNRSKHMGTVQRALQKIADFIDSLVNLFTTTSRGVVRAFETGEIFQREATIQAGETILDKGMPIFQAKRGFTYLINCVGSTAEKINTMVDQAKEITYDTFVKNVSIKELEDMFPFYEWGPGKKGGLRLKDDYAVSYYRSKYEGEPAYYIDHSAIEYVFTRQEGRPSYQVKPREDMPLYALAGKKAIGAPENKKLVQDLNNQLAKQLGKEWENAYRETVEVPESIRGLIEAFRATFKTRVIAISPTEKEFSRIAGQTFKGTLFIDTHATKGFLQLAGHELLHKIKQERPDLYDSFLSATRNAYWNIEEFRQAFSETLLPGEADLAPSKLEEELIADFTGDALADQDFLKYFAREDPGTFKKFMRTVINWLNDIANKLSKEGFGSSRYFTDVDKLRTYLDVILADFATRENVDVIDDTTPPVFSRIKSPEALVLDEKVEDALKAKDFIKILNQYEKKLKSAENKLEKIKTSKDILKKRREFIKAARDHFNLTDREMRQISGKDIRFMSNYEFKQYIDGIRLRAEKVEIRRQAMNELMSHIQEKELNIENLRKAMKLPTLKNMTVAQIKKLDETLEPFQKGDEFLSVRKLEVVDRTELKGIKTWREARERLSEKLGVPVTELQNIRVSEFDRFRYETGLAEKNIFYKMMVEETAKRMLVSEAEYLKIEKDIFALAKKLKGVGFFVPQHKNIRAFMEASVDKKAEIKLTEEESAIAEYMTRHFSDARDYLLQIEAMNMGKENYFTHVRRGILEAVKEDGIVEAVKEQFESYKLDEQGFNILDKETGEILAMDKFFKFAMHRTGKLKPTENVVKAFLTYMRTFKKKQALDEITPLIDIYAHALTPKGMTKKGLLLHGNLIKFVKEWVNTQKGRHITIIAKQNGKIDAALRAIKMFTSLRDLGLNIPVSVATEIGEQITTYQLLGKKNFAIGKLRQNTKQGKTIIEKYRNLIGKNPWGELAEPSKRIGDRLMEGIFVLFRDASERANKTFLLGSLSKEEFKAGEISSERLAALRTELGRYRMIAGMKSVIGATPEGKAYTQYKRWAIPILRTTIKNLGNIGKKITGQKPDSKAFKKSALELYRLAEITALVMLTFGMVRDEDDDSFVGKMINKAYREATTLIQALQPSMFLTAGRTASFVEKLGTNLTLILQGEQYKTTDEYKGIKKLKKQFTPIAVSQFTGGDIEGREVGRFKKNLKKINAANENYKELLKEDKAKAREYDKDTKRIRRFAVSFGAASRDIAKLKKQKKTIDESRILTTERKKVLTQNINEKMNKIAQRYNKYLTKE